MAKVTVSRICSQAALTSKSVKPSISTGQRRCLSSTTTCHATPLPITATGPPPSPPEPAVSQYSSRVESMRKKAAQIQAAKDIRAAQQPGNKSSPLRKRFWKDVHVTTVPEGYQVHLDTRPVRTPNKTILTVPKSKAHLAHGIAIEWDLLSSAAQALKGHNIPLTSIVSRALDIIEAEAQGDTKVRHEILKVMMRYLETDTLLCWAPPPEANSRSEELGMEKESGTQQSLRSQQQSTAEQITSYLNATVWPGVEIKPVLEGNNIMPTKQTDVTNSIISGWIAGLPAFELAALERAALATKSLLVATRLVVEWSQEFRDVRRDGVESRFGIEEAALASTIEVRWQTGMWGEVEDTHDVEKEDLRRQLGSAVLMICGWR